MEHPLWQPNAARKAAANLTDFLGRTGFEDYGALYEWSVDEAEAFWAALWEFLEIQSIQPFDKAVEGVESFTTAKWFPGVQMNFAENILRRADTRPALVYRREDGMRREFSRKELYDQVARAAGAMKEHGIGVGDRVAGILPNIPEAVVFMLAANSLGAIWSLAAPEFGIESILDRLDQIAPKMLIGTDGYLYKGRRFETLGRLKEIISRMPSVETVVVVPALEGRGPLSMGRKALWMDTFVGPHEAASMTFHHGPFDLPAFVLYSSGTTGRPKCIVHGGGGVLLQLLKECRLHYDIKPGDRFFYHTSTGWNMWYWLVVALAAEAVVVLYDGYPFTPGPSALFDMAQAERITHFGTSPKYLEIIRKNGLVPAKSHDLRALRCVLSTGSPLSHESFDIVYQDIKEDLCLSSISGGTEIMTCFATGNPLAPVWRGELQSLALGMKAEVFDEGGRPLTKGKGELVCTRPFPSTPVGFWNDPGGDRYFDAYFARFPGVWHHGDYAEMTAHGGMIIHGRSDATLKPGGVRIGTAEIYRPVEQLDEVEESLVVGQDWQGDVRVVLFVKLRPGLTLNESLTARIKARIREAASPRHVPAVIIQTPAVPRTRTGKLAELAVRRIIHGQDIDNRDAMEDPDALDFFVNLPQLQ